MFNDPIVDIFGDPIKRNIAGDLVHNDGIVPVDKDETLYHRDDIVPVDKDETLYDRVVPIEQ